MKAPLAPCSGHSTEPHQERQKRLCPEPAWSVAAGIETHASGNKGLRLRTRAAAQDSSGVASRFLLGQAREYSRSQDRGQDKEGRRNSSLVVLAWTVPKNDRSSSPARPLPSRGVFLIDTMDAYAFSWRGQVIPRCPLAPRRHCADSLRPTSPRGCGRPRSATASYTPHECGHLPSIAALRRLCSSSRGQSRKNSWVKCL